MGGPPIPVKVPIKPEHIPAIVIFLILAFKFHFFALKKTVIKSNKPKIIKKFLVPIVNEIKGTDIKVPTILPEKE